MPFLVAFGNKARQGKDFAANHLAKVYGGKYDIKLYSFGKALKIEMYDYVLANPLHPFWSFRPDLAASAPRPSDYVTDPELKLAWIERHKLEGLATIMQSYGTEYIRARDPFHWVKAVDKQIAQDKPLFAFITDLRFLNEFLYVKSTKGFTVRCVREGYVDPTRDASHVSETELDRALFDYTISVPDGATKELCQDAETVFEEIICKLTPDVPEEGDGFTKVTA